MTGPRTDAAFVFICQGGDIEINAMMLAASLRRHTLLGTELIACVPDPEQGWAEPDRRTLDLLRDLDCRVTTIRNPVDPAYGLANKIACLDVDVTSRRRIFLDSDILCLRPFEPGILPSARLAAKPADEATFGDTPAPWQEAYAMIGLPLPETRFTTTVTGRSTPPYFNSGVIVTDRDLKIAGDWADTMRQMERVPNRYFREQAAFAITVIRLGLDYALIDESLNYPANMKPVNPGSEPVFCHYHYPHIIRREPVIHQAVRQIVREYPYIGHRMQEANKWARLVRPHRRRKGIRFFLPTPRPQPVDDPVRIPEIVLTGIPRSGTSYLCRLLGRYRDCAVINEPREAVLSLQNSRVPWELSVFFRETRMRILNVDMVKNKLDGREVREDTAEEDARTPWFPLVYRADFILGIKNTQSFLCRIGGILEAMPDARIVANIRNPYDTIASWKSSFPHLADADVENIPVGHAEDPFMSEDDRDRLRAIRGAASPAERRARLWVFLAERILAHRNRLITVRYQDLVLRPAETMERILSGLPAGRPSPPLAPSVVRSKTDRLDDEDREAIAGLCMPAARALGVADGIDSAC